VSQDIREWAREHGHPVSDRGRIPKAVTEEYEASLNGGPEPEWEDDEEPVLITAHAVDPEPEPGPPAAPEPTPARVEERPPVRPRRERLRRLTKPAATGKKSFPRVSTAELLGFAYAGAGYILARNPRMIPVARSMDLMAPVSGEILDDVVRGTVVDRLLQPLARSGDKGRKLGAVAGFPALVAVAVARPELYPVLKPAMKMALMLSLEVSETPRRKLEQRAAKFQEKYGGVDLDSMVDAVFADIDMPVAPSSAEDAAVKRARGD
jgi:Lsr2